MLNWLVFYRVCVSKGLQMSDFQIVPVLKLSRQAMRLVNRRAFEIGGNDYFAHVRKYLLDKIDRQVKAGMVVKGGWLEDTLADSSSEEMMRWQTEGGND